MSASDAQTPKDFNLDNYINTGAMGFNYPLFQKIMPDSEKNNHEPPIQQVHLLFHPLSGASLLESPLSTDQQSWEDDEGLHITATVNMTSQLVWWLRGFGKGLRKIEPEILSIAVFETQTPNQQPTAQTISE